MNLVIRFSAKGGAKASLHRFIMKNYIGRIQSSLRKEFLIEKPYVPLRQKSEYYVLSKQST